MSIQVYVTSSSINEGESLKLNDCELLSTLGDKEDNIAVQLQELFESVIEQIKPSIMSESTLSIEISGAITLKANGGAKFLVFEVGGNAETTNTIKVALNTTLKP